MKRIQIGSGVSIALTFIYTLPFLIRKTRTDTWILPCRIPGSGCIHAEDPCCGIRRFCPVAPDMNERTRCICGEVIQARIRRRIDRFRQESRFCVIEDVREHTVLASGERGLDRRRVPRARVVERAIPNQERVTGRDEDAIDVATHRPEDVLDAAIADDVVRTIVSNRYHPAVGIVSILRRLTNRQRVLVLEPTI